MTPTSTTIQEIPGITGRKAQLEKGTYILEEESATPLGGLLPDAILDPTGLAEVQEQIRIWLVGGSAPDNSDRIEELSEE